MGAAYSSGRRPAARSSRPSRHAWGRIQDVEYVDSEDEEKEDDSWWSGDRRVFVEEKADWPRSCPVLHLNIQQDFPLDAQRALVRSCYRFWLFSWWVSVINFVAVMATLLTSNVTNPGSMLLSFVLSIVYLFAVFFMYFRPLYWALRLESTVLFIWFYIFTLVLVAFFFYMISQALGLVSILAQPLAPGSQLPVKINPIFPVVLFTLVVLFYLFAFVMSIYYLSAAIKWHRMTDRDKLKMFKMQKKKKWLAPWNGGDDEIADVDDDGEKPRYTYPCILSYEKAFDDYTDDVDGDEVNEELPPGYQDKDQLRKSRRRKKKHKKPKKKGKHSHQVLTIPGRIGIYPTGRKVMFKSDEAIFNNVYNITVMLVNIKSMKTKEATWLYMVEKLNASVLEEDRKEYHHVSATCSSEEDTIRILKFDFDTKQNRQDCYKHVDRLWRAVKKKEQLYIAEDEKSLREIRLRQASLIKERAAQHLLTHRDWKLIVSYVWRKTYQAGEIIHPKDYPFREIMHVTEGTVDIFLETTETAEQKLNAAESQLDEDFDLQAILFPTMEEVQSHKTVDITLLDHSGQSRSQPRYFTVRFNKRKLGFAYRKKDRTYNLSDFDEALVNGLPKRTFPDNIAAVVHSVKPKSEAARVGLRVGDELVKVGLYDIEANNLSQKAITNLIKNHSFPMTMEFRRPPDIALEEDQQGFIVPSDFLVPETARKTMQDYQLQNQGLSSPPRVVLNPRASSSYDEDEEQALLSSVQIHDPYTDYMTSDEEDEEDEFVAADESRDVVSELEVARPRPPGRSDRAPSMSSFKAEPVTPRGAGPVEMDLMAFPENERETSFIQRGQERRGGRFRRSKGPARSAILPVFGGALEPEEDDDDDELSRLELAEQFASQGGEVGEDVRVEFDANAPPPTIEELERQRKAAVAPAVSVIGSVPRSAHDADQANTSFTSRLIEKGRSFLFGKPFEYDKVEEDALRSRLRTTSEGVELKEGRFGQGEDDEISLIVDRDGDDWDPDHISVGSDDSMGNYFKSVRTFEPVGTFEKGDTVGIIPWILNQPVAVAQLEAKTDVVIHSIQVSDLTKLFKKNSTLALAFFKYVAAVIGERADRDEEHLCDQLELDTIKRDSEATTSLTRLLDQKPIRSTQKTMFEKREKELLEARQWFEQDFDMATDNIIFQVPCHARIVGDISILVGESWYGIDTRDSESYNELKEGALYITQFHLCFRTKKRALDLAKLRRRPVLYGKLHLNDIYEIRRLSDSEEKMTVLTDDVRLDITFEDLQTSVLVEDWLNALLKAGRIVEQAPHSYTLPGDLYGFSSGTDKDLPDTILNDPLNVAYQQQRGLRAEFLVLTQTLQQVLTKHDKYKIFHEGRSVTYRKGQNVLVASRFSAKRKDEDEKDPKHSRRTATNKRALQLDGPNGLYLVGSGELVVQREVNGRRIQFASYKVGTVFGVERFLTGAPSPFTVKVASETAMLKFAPRDRCMALLRSDLPLAARFYQYCALLQMQRLRGPILSRPMEDDDDESEAQSKRGSRGCHVL